MYKSTKQVSVLISGASGHALHLLLDPRIVYRYLEKSGVSRLYNIWDVDIYTDKDMSSFHKFPQS